MDYAIAVVCVSLYAMRCLDLSVSMVIPKIMDVLGWNFLGRWDTEHGEVINF